MFYLLTVSKGKTEDKLGTHSKRIFLKKIRSIKFTESNLKVYLRVNYGKGLNNEGEYETENELWQAFKAFTER